MGLTFASSYEVMMEIPCSLEQVRRAIAINLRSLGATNLPYGAAVGVIEKNHFSLHFNKPGRNFWRPEFKGDFSATGDHVKIFVWCGLSKQAEAATVFFWLLMAFALVSFLGRVIAGHINLVDCFGSCVTFFGGFGLPVVAFWKEFRGDRIKMGAILDGIESEGKEGNIGR
jgi:hypothetical protein